MKEEKEKHKFAENKEIMVLKPKIINALFPLFLKYFLISLLFCAVLFGVSLILEKFGITLLPIVLTITAFVILAFIISIIPLASKIFRFAFTKYIFYETSVVKEFRFIIIKKQSVIYSRITNVSLDISIWDRICGAGDITLHTDDDEPDIVLKFIRHPEEIEHKIYSLIKKENRTVIEKQESSDE